MHKVKTRGFTIVELLIVIVVIAILAAITIVAYNGIQSRARASAAAAALNGAAKKIALYQVENASSVYPTDLESAGVTDTETVKYQYKRDITSTPATYCITATVSGASYYQTNSAAAPQLGACAGHGADGVAPVTNIAINPSLETDGSLWTANYATNGNGSTTVQTSGGYSGNNFYRMSWSTGATAVGRGAEHGQTNTATTIKPNTGYAASVWVRVTRVQTMTLALLYTGTSGSGISQPEGPQVTIQPNVWTRLTHTSTSPSGTAGLTARVYAASGGTAWQSGDTLDVDGLFIAEGSTLYNYADGNTAGWAWNGAVNNSPSTGSPK